MLHAIFGGKDARFLKFGYEVGNYSGVLQQDQSLLVTIHGVDAHLLYQISEY